MNICHLKLSSGKTELGLLAYTQIAELCIYIFAINSGFSELLLKSGSTYQYCNIIPNCSAKATLSSF